MYAYTNVFSALQVCFFSLSLWCVGGLPNHNWASQAIFFFLFLKKVIFTQQVYNLTPKKRRIESSGLELWWVSVMVEWKKFPLKKTGKIFLDQKATACGNLFTCCQNDLSNCQKCNHRQTLNTVLASLDWVGIEHFCLQIRMWFCLQETGLLVSESLKVILPWLLPLGWAPFIIEIRL